MGLFGKKKDAPAACDCVVGGNATPAEGATATSAGGARVKVLGSGCAKCNALEAATKEALAALSVDTAIDHVTDFAQIAAYGVMTTPALVVDGKVVSFGKVLKKSEVVELLKKAMS